MWDFYLHLADYFNTFFCLEAKETKIQGCLKSVEEG